MLAETQWLYLANNNIVGGINIDATGANFGVLGADITGGTFGGGTFNNVTASQVRRLDGVLGFKMSQGNLDILNNNNVSQVTSRDGIIY